MDAQIAQPVGVEPLAFLPRLHHIGHQQEVEDDEGQGDGHRDREAEHGIIGQRHYAKQLVQQGQKEIEDDEKIAEDGVITPAGSVISVIQYADLFRNAIDVQNQNSNDHKQFHLVASFGPIIAQIILCDRFEAKRKIRVCRDEYES